MRKLSILLVVLLLAVPSGVFADQPDCAQTWIHSHTLELPAGYWSEGSHTYEFEAFDGTGTFSFVVNFDVTTTAPEVDGQVILRIARLTSEDGILTEIHPDQDTALQVSFLWVDDPSGDAWSRKDAEAGREVVSVRVSIDGGDWIDLPAGPLKKACTFENPGHFRKTWGPKIY